jgi:hypothetical protein
MSELSTVAGASVAAPSPWPRASKPTASTGRVDLGDAEQLLDLVLGVALADVDGLAAEAAGLRQPLLDEVGDDDDGRTEQLRTGRCREADRTGTGDVDGRAGLDARRHGAVEAGREDVGQHRQVEDLLHRLVAVRELQQVPVGVRDRDVVRLPADPAAHVDVAVRSAGTRGVDVEADPGLALLAVPAAAARDVEGHRAQVPDLDELDVGADLGHLAEDLVPEHEVLRRGRATADHVLVAAADVGRDDLEDDAVVELAADVRRVDARAVLQLELGVVDVLDLDLARADVGRLRGCLP